MAKEALNTYVVGGLRSPFAKSMTALAKVNAQDLMVTPLKALVEKYGLRGKLAGDVALGSVLNLLPRWNLAREAVLDSGLDPSTPGFNVGRACGTGLETAALIAAKAASGFLDFGIGGGVDTNSDLPFLFRTQARDKFLKVRNSTTLPRKLLSFADFTLADFNPEVPAAKERRTGLSMGEHCEQMVKEWKISREAQDQLALESHQKAAAAYRESFYQDLVVELAGFSQDKLVRGDTSLEKLAKLKAAFDFSGAGSLTAGNSTPLTDGAACVLISNERALKEQKWTPQARIVDYAQAGVDFVGGEGLLMAPTIAVARLLERNNMQLQDFDFYEIHEAFAGQVLCTLKAWESDEYCRRRLGQAKALGPIDRSRMNIKGGSLALGHPFAATGARIMASLAKILSQHGRGRGLISICTAGGMGVACILEAP
jgi:acetyl-CoA C-acetyltransferase